MLRLYDTAIAQIVEVTPRRVGEFSMYCCGPTVYDLPHIGHGRAMLSWDLFRRYIEWTGATVHHVANITNVDESSERAPVAPSDGGGGLALVSHKTLDDSVAVQHRIEDVVMAWLTSDIAATPTP